MGAPIPLLLFCPRCGVQHIDAPEPGTGWTNPPHRSHQCKNPKCRDEHGKPTVWRPADVETTGVAAITTKGPGDGDPRPTLTPVGSIVVVATEFELHRGQAELYHQVMELQRDMLLEHGRCEPRQDRACTRCNAAERYAALVASYRGRRVIAAAGAPAIAAAA